MVPEPTVAHSTVALPISPARSSWPTGQRCYATDWLSVRNFLGSPLATPKHRSQSQELQSRSLAGRCQVCATTHLPSLGRCRARHTLRKPVLADVVLEALAYQLLP